MAHTTPPPEHIKHYADWPGAIFAVAAPQGTPDAQHQIAWYANQPRIGGSGVTVVIRPTPSAEDIGLAYGQGAPDGTVAKQNAALYSPTANDHAVVTAYGQFLEQKKS